MGDPGYDHEQTMDQGLCHQVSLLSTRTIHAHDMHVFSLNLNACVLTISSSMAPSPSVGDSDNFRIYHTPGIGWRWPLKFRRIPSTAKGVISMTQSLLPLPSPVV